MLLGYITLTSARSRWAVNTDVRPSIHPRSLFQFYLLPVLLQRRQSGEVSRVVHDLELLEDAAHRDDIHIPADVPSSRRFGFAKGRNSCVRRGARRSAVCACMLKALESCTSSGGCERVTNRELEPNSVQSVRAAVNFLPDSKSQTDPPPCDRVTFRHVDQSVHGGLWSAHHTPFAQSRERTRLLRALWLVNTFRGGPASIR